MSWAFVWAAVLGVRSGVHPCVRPRVHPSSCRPGVFLYGVHLGLRPSVRGSIRPSVVQASFSTASVRASGFLASWLAGISSSGEGRRAARIDICLKCERVPKKPKDQGFAPKPICEKCESVPKNKKTKFHTTICHNMSGMPKEFNILAI